MNPQAWCRTGVVAIAILVAGCAHQSLRSSLAEAEEELPHLRVPVRVDSLPDEPPVFTAPAADGNWVPIGPAPIATGYSWTATGRINSVLISRTDPAVLLIAGDRGGIWRSVDSGQSFSLVTETVGRVTDMESSAADPLVIYAAADGDESIRAHSLYQCVVYRSTDGGKTWIALRTFPKSTSGITRVIPDAISREEVMLLTYGGLYESTDLGAHWSALVQCVFCDAVRFESMPNFILLNRALPDALPSGLYRSGDGGHTWSAVLRPFDASDVVQGVLGASASTGTAYWCGQGNSGVSKVFMTTDGGVTWTQRTATAAGASGCPEYIAVSAANASSVYFGFGQNDLYASTDGGNTFSDITNYYHGTFRPLLHVDNRGYGANGNTSHEYFATDGGLYTSVNRGQTISSMNDRVPPFAQFYSVAASPTDARVIVGGTQDNGLLMSGPDATSPWRTIGGGDAAGVVFDKNDPARILWVATISGNTVYRVSGLPSKPSTQISTSIETLEKEGGRPYALAYAAPIAVSSRGTVYFGTWHLWASNDFGTAWSRTSDLDLTRGRPDVLAFIGIAPADPNVIYTISGNGRVMHSADGGATWDDLSAAFPISAPQAATGVVSIGDGKMAFIGITNFAGTTPGVFRTTNSGATWTRAGDFPAISVHSLYADSVEPLTVYAGTDSGVFRSQDGGISWSFYGNGLPRVPVAAITRAADGRMVAATFGRGAYAIYEPRRRSMRR